MTGLRWLACQSSIQHLNHFDREPSYMCYLQVAQLVSPKGFFGDVYGSHVSQARFLSKFFGFRSEATGRLKDKYSVLTWWKSVLPFRVSCLVGL